MEKKKPLHIGRVFVKVSCKVTSFTSESQWCSRVFLSPPVCCIDRSGWMKTVWRTARVWMAFLGSISVKSVKGLSVCSGTIWKAIRCVLCFFITSLRLLHSTSPKLANEQLLRHSFTYDILSHLISVTLMGASRVVDNHTRLSEHIQHKPV